MSMYLQRNAVKTFWKIPWIINVASEGYRHFIQDQETGKLGGIQWTFARLFCPSLTTGTLYLLPKKFKPLTSEP